MGSSTCLSFTLTLTLTLFCVVVLEVCSAYPRISDCCTVVTQQTAEMERTSFQRLVSGFEHQLSTSLAQGTGGEAEVRDDGDSANDMETLKKLLRCALKQTTEREELRSTLGTVDVARTCYLPLLSACCSTLQVRWKKETANQKPDSNQTATKLRISETDGAEQSVLLPEEVITSDAVLLLYLSLCLLRNLCHQNHDLQELLMEQSTVLVVQSCLNTDTVTEVITHAGMKRILVLKAVRAFIQLCCNLTVGNDACARHVFHTRCYSLITCCFLASTDLIQKNDCEEVLEDVRTNLLLLWYYCVRGRPSLMETVCREQEMLSMVLRYILRNSDSTHLWQVLRWMISEVVIASKYQALFSGFLQLVKKKEGTSLVPWIAFCSLWVELVDGNELKQPTAKVALDHLVHLSSYLLSLRDVEQNTDQPALVTKAEVHQLDDLLWQLSAFYSQVENLHEEPLGDSLRLLLELALDMLQSTMARSFKGSKCTLIRLVGNLTYRNKAHQDAVRNYTVSTEFQGETTETNGLFLILTSCVLDEQNPYIREWTIFAIRNLCEDNIENQAMIKELRLQEACESSILRKAGLKIEVTADGRPAVVPVDDS